MSKELGRRLASYTAVVTSAKLNLSLYSALLTALILIFHWLQFTEFTYPNIKNLVYLGLGMFCAFDFVFKNCG